MQSKLPNSSAKMSVGSPLLSQEFAALHAEEFSFLSDQSTTMDSSDLFDLHNGDENFLPSNAVSFTPKRFKPQPRAWERKPSTPFAPRGEGQKIWKRFPLQNVTSSINASWRKDNSRGDGIMRPVKRLRVGASGNVGDKENKDYVVARWDAEASPEKKNHRKTSSTQQERALASAMSSSIEHVQPSAEAAEGLPDEAVSSSEILPDTCDQSALNEESMVQLKRELELDSEQDPQRQSPGGSEGNHAAAAQLLDEADVFLRISPHTSPATFAPTEMQVAPSPDPKDPTECDEIMSPVMEPSQLQHPDNALEANLEVGKEQMTGHQLLPAPAYVDPDDTSYLQDFLLRSRAQRAAKIQPMYPTEGTPEKPALTGSAEAEGGLVMLKASAVTSGSPPPSPPTDSMTNVDDDDDTEAKASSPCRRSSRTTRLPRPQKPTTTLPSSIALRRLNGTEFIAMQREAQSLAVATRGNTRKNRGGGIGVKARLMQLKSEADADAESLIEAQDVPRKSSKRISWAETLARFQEYNETPHSPPETEAPGNPSQAVEETQEVSAEPEEKTSTRRVKKLRKDSVGSVNGTPAPKRSIEILLEGAAETTGQDAAAVSQQTGKRTRSRTRS